MSESPRLQHSQVMTALLEKFSFEGVVEGWVEEIGKSTLNPRADALRLGHRLLLGRRHCKIRHPQQKGVFKRAGAFR